MSDSAIGYIFHRETFGAVDGPGLRLVLFLQGCPLRCPYCHNPEGQPLSIGQEITIEEVMAQLARYASYYKGGGLTISGGEPLVQSAFVGDLLARCHTAGIHTVLDTSACIQTEEAMAACQQADLLLLDVKTALPEQHQAVFGFPLTQVEAMLAQRQSWQKPVWVRQVIAPGLTANQEQIMALARLLKPYSVIERVELLPFRKLCLPKYAALGLDFPMKDTPEPSAEMMAGLRAILAENLPGVKVL